MGGSIGPASAEESSEESGSAEESTELDTAWAHMTAHVGAKRLLFSTVDANALPHHDQDYYLFGGSSTTPRRSEGVRGIVMKEFNTATQDQIAKSSHAMHHTNNHPLQPVNARMIVQ